MINSIFRGFGSGFGRALGRIFALLVIGLIVMLFLQKNDVDLSKINPLRMFLLNVNAMEQTGDFQMTTPYDSPCGSGGSGYCAIQTNQNVALRSLNHTYNGVLQCINFEVNYTFNSNYQYNLYLEGMSTDFRNNSIEHFVFGYHNSPSQANVISTTFRFVSKSKLQISFPKGLSYSHYPITICGSPLTGISNYGIKKAYLKYDDGQQDIGGVIENNNTNTQNIIENNNSNTQDIINNQNENQEQTNQLLGSCYKNLFNYNIYNNSTSYFQKNNNYGFTITGDYYTFNPNITLAQFCPSCQVGKTYYLHAESNSPDSKFIYLSGSNVGWNFGSSKTLTQADLNSTINFYNRWEHSSSDVTNINNIMITEKNVSTFGEYNKNVCNSKLDNVQDSITDVNDTLTDSSIDSDLGSSFFEDFEDEDFGLSGILTLPLTTIQSLTSKTCTALQIPIPFTNNKKITLPCMTAIYEEHFGAIYDIYKVVSFGIISYFICINIFAMVKGFKDPDNDKVEVMEL